jgi:hypothetical protein
MGAIFIRFDANMMRGALQQEVAVELRVGNPRADVENFVENVSALLQATKSNGHRGIHRRDAEGAVNQKL